MAVIVVFDRMEGEDVKTQAFGPCDPDVAKEVMKACFEREDCVSVEIVPLEKGQWGVFSIYGKPLRNFPTEQAALDWVIQQHPGSDIATIDKGGDKQVYINGKHACNIN